MDARYAWSLMVVLLTEYSPVLVKELQSSMKEARDDNMMLQMSEISARHFWRLLLLIEGIVHLSL